MKIKVIKPFLDRMSNYLQRSIGDVLTVNEDFGEKIISGGFGIKHVEGIEDKHVQSDYQYSDTIGTPKTGRRREP